MAPLSTLKPRSSSRRSKLHINLVTWVPTTYDQDPKCQQCTGGKEGNYYTNIWSSLAFRHGALQFHLCENANLTSLFLLGQTLPKLKNHNQIKNQNENELINLYFHNKVLHECRDKQLLFISLELSSIPEST